MYQDLGTDCPSHMLPKSMLCCSDQVLVCYRCLIFGQHRGHKCRDEEETRKLLEKKKEEDKMMEEIMNSVKEGKVKIAEMFKELMESFTSSFEHEKKKLERQYDLFVDKTIKENDDLIQNLQFHPVKLALQTFQLVPGNINIQWPEFKVNLATDSPGTEVQNSGEEPCQEGSRPAERQEEVLTTEAEEEEEVEDKNRMVRILSIESPWRIHVRDTSYDEEWEIIRQAITEDGEDAYYYHYVEDLQKGDVVLGYVDGRWERVIIKDDEDSSNPRVKLIDVGETRRVPTRDLRQMSRHLQKSECFRQTISLAGLEPQPEQKAWQFSLSRKLKQILKVGEVYTFRKSEGVKNMGDLMIEEKNFEKVSMTEILIKLNQQLSRVTSARSPGKVGIPPESSRSLLSPRLPKRKVFRAKIVHMDQLGVVWVIPNDHIKLLSEVTSLLSNIKNLQPQEELEPGQLSIIRRDQRLLRGRILRVVGRQVDYINIDSGEVGECEQEEVYRATAQILFKLPLAIPLKPYGVRRTNGQGLNKNSIKRLLLSIPRQQVTVCLLDPADSSNFPLPANVRYSVRGEDDLVGNLALGLMMNGHAEMITNHREWRQEHQDSGLAWLREETDLQPYPPPHPFPIAEGLWFSVTVQAVFYPNQKDQFPSVNCPKSNKVSCHLLPLSSNLKFDPQQSKINSSFQLSEKPLLALNTAFEEMRTQLAVDSVWRVVRKRLAKGDKVLLETNGEWCRTEVLGTEESGKKVNLFFSDYGHPGTSDVALLRYQEVENILEPLQRRDFVFQMPENDQALVKLVSLLEKRYEETPARKLLARIEHIVLTEDTSSDGDLEEIHVTFWDARMKDGMNGHYELEKIC